MLLDMDYLWQPFGHISSIGIHHLSEVFFNIVNKIGTIKVNCLQVTNGRQVSLKLTVGPWHLTLTETLAFLFVGSILCCLLSS